eukprot:5883253-Lingulodinium_polyedra.AAC.1
METSGKIYIHCEASGKVTWLSKEQETVQPKFPTIVIEHSENILTVEILGAYKSGAKAFWDLSQGLYIVLKTIMASTLGCKQLWPQLLLLPLFLEDEVSMKSTSNQVAHGSHGHQQSLCCSHPGVAEAPDQPE